MPYFALLTLFASASSEIIHRHQGPARLAGVILSKHDLTRDGLPHGSRTDCISTRPLSFSHALVGPVGGWATGGGCPTNSEAGFVKETSVVGAAAIPRPKNNVADLATASPCNATGLLAPTWAVSCHATKRPQLQAAACLSHGPASSHLVAFRHQGPTAPSFLPFPTCPDGLERPTYDVSCSHVITASDKVNLKAGNIGYFDFTLLTSSFPRQSQPWGGWSTYPAIIRRIVVLIRLFDDCIPPRCPSLLF